jgi:hypothetical protein
MDKTIDMARDAGGRAQQQKHCDVEYLMGAGALEAFEALVRADERSAIAKFFDDHWRETWTDAQAAEAIRAMWGAK